MTGLGHRVPAEGDGRARWGRDRQAAPAPVSHEAPWKGSSMRKIHRTMRCKRKPPSGCFNTATGTHSVVSTAWPSVRWCMACPVPTAGRRHLLLGPGGGHTSQHRASHRSVFYHHCYLCDVSDQKQATFLKGSTNPQIKLQDADS